MKKRLLAIVAAILIVYLTVGRGISIKHEIGKVLPMIIVHFPKRSVPGLLKYRWAASPS